VSVEWLSVGTADHSDVDAEAWRVRVTAGRSCGGDAEARLVEITATTWRHGGSRADSDLEVRSVWTQPPFQFKPYYRSSDPLPF
jgi:hypothetical protein